jgi:hypothetical protein
MIWSFLVPSPFFEMVPSGTTQGCFPPQLTYIMHMPFSIHNYWVKFAWLHDEANAKEALNKFCEKHLVP